ncbi:MULTISPECIES: hypothetical protein [Bradyrhizobium]|uniref:Uncharacterized protein n=1 Tax=Bradyrhizobium vignae TaxID=1549949 RepID=A0A2U3Q6R0_9BRAD|nr:hypothetical protein [Bradyrhizobium vignae]MBP0113861.1 hypothetical protein [Bradyrhizobium vignae]RXG89318.1 hypothetical protein EAV90_30130 [Bradyrhizobium vignae]SPP96989.1 protein of unknown function [Bradyrhizobium vignae]
MAAVQAGAYINVLFTVDIIVIGVNRRGVPTPIGRISLCFTSHWTGHASVPIHSDGSIVDQRADIVADEPPGPIGLGARRCEDRSP